MNSIYVTDYLLMQNELVPHFRAGLKEMADIAQSVRPVSAKDFTKRSAAIHESAHCVIAVLEGERLKHAKIWNEGGFWLGEYMRKGEVISIDDPQRFLAHLRVILAGRRGEHLFSDDPSPHVGLDEFVYFDLYIMKAIACCGLDIDSTDDYRRLRGSQFIEVDEALRANRDALLKLALKLERDECVRGSDIHRLLKDIEARKSAPEIRPLEAVAGITMDMLDTLGIESQAKPA